MGTKRLPHVFTDSAAETPDAAKFNNDFSHVNMVPWNLVNNGDFGKWASGAASAPDDWTLYGSGASAARETDSVYGDYSACLTYGTADSYLRQLSAEQNAVRGRTVKAWCWVKCSGPNMARIKVSDGAGASVSAFHSGSGDWEYLSLTHEVAESATALALELHIEGSGIALFDGATLVDFDDITGLLPSMKDVQAAIDTSTLAKLGEDNIFTADNEFQGKITGDGAEPNNLPVWRKITKTYADFASAANTNTVTLFTLPAMGIIHQVVIKHGAAFTGGALTGYTVAVGTADKNSKYASPFDVFQSVDNAALQSAVGGFMENSGSGLLITATATSAGAQLNAASQGSVDIWVLCSVLN